MKNSKRIIFRILLLASIAILMILLCGCRTRLSNNSSVHSKIEDETGYMTENYEYRRDDLGLSVAEKPLINPDNGEDEEDYEEEFDYEPSQTDPYEDDTTIEDTDTDNTDDKDDKDSTSTSTRTTSGTTRRSTTGVRRSSTTTTTTAVQVTLNANGGTCKKKSIYVRKGSTYGTLPSAERDGYTFKGWYTKKDNDKGTKVTSKTKVTLSTAHTLYAHWKEQKKQTYTVSFDTNSGGEVVNPDPITVEEGGTYGNLPRVSRDARVGYDFLGWFTEKGDGEGNEITKGDDFTANADQTLYAHWSDDLKAWWETEFDDAAKQVADSMPYYIIKDHPDHGIGKTDTKQVKKMLDDCGGSEETDQGYAEYAILLVDAEEDKFIEIAESAVQAYRNMEEHADYNGSIIVISKEALSKNSNENLVARIRLLNTLFQNSITPLDADKAAEQLGIDKTLIYVFPPAVGE